MVIISLTQLDLLTQQTHLSAALFLPQAIAHCPIIITVAMQDDGAHQLR
jgi:hypothetical protein